MEDKFDVTYGCGCVHELSRDASKGQHMYQPTGKNKYCAEHKKE